MKFIFLLLTGFSLVIAGCNKPKDSSANEVWIRVENNTSVPMTEILITDVSYNSLNPQNTTGYKLITLPVYAAACYFKVNGQDAWAGNGVCGSPPPPPFEPGYYTFRVGSTTYPNYFSIEVIKK